MLADLKKNIATFATISCTSLVEILTTSFENPKFAIAPGQSIVFYAGDTCIGGGYIETRSNKNIS